MAGNQQYTVGTTPTLLASAPANSVPGATGWVQIANGTAITVYLGGGTSVSSSNGYALAVSSSLPVNLFSGDNIYGVTASATTVVSVLATGA